VGVSVEPAHSVFRHSLFLREYATQREIQELALYDIYGHAQAKQTGLLPSHFVGSDAGIGLKKRVKT
jgi:hypothetical protein